MLRDDPQTPGEESAARRTGRELRQALAQISDEEDAERAADALERSAGNLSEEEVAKGKAAAVPSVPSKDPAEAILATAREAASTSTSANPAVDTAIEQATGHSAEAPAVTGATRNGRRLLREELLRRMGTLDALDARVFLMINHLPHPIWADRWMARLTWIMTGGHGWIAVLGLLALFYPRDARRAAFRTLPALWLTTAAVEYPIKRFCRRRRPFIDIVRAIVVGRKPGSYSFPSGHSAAAFAGAVLLGRCFPRLRGIFLALAGATAFSRVYLGAHYPGDVVSGSMIGAALSRSAQKLFSNSR